MMMRIERALLVFYADTAKEPRTWTCFLLSALQYNFACDQMPCTPTVLTSSRKVECSMDGLASALRRQAVLIFQAEYTVPN